MGAQDRLASHLHAGTFGTFPPLASSDFDQFSFKLGKSAQHRQHQSSGWGCCATRFGQDVGVAVLSYRSLALGTLGYFEAALADAEHALTDAREIGQAATLMFTLSLTSFTHILCGNYATAAAQIDEVVALAEEKAAQFWKVQGILARGWLFALTGKTSDAVREMTSGITALRSTGATIWLPLWFSCLARSYAELSQLDDAWRCIREATTTAETTRERVWEADIQRIAGEIELMSPEPDASQSKAYFERALALARKQQAKSWELRLHEPCTPLARPGQAAARSRTACSGLRVVHGRI
jgi:predicted ATPase